MKKLICTLFALAICASMAACGGEPAETTNSSNEQTAATTTTKADTTTNAPTTTDAPATTQAPVTTTQASVTTQAPVTTTTKAPVTTQAPETTTTKAPVTTKAPETTTTKAPVTEPTPAECSHDYKVGATKDATCTAKGSKTYTCSKCGDTYSEEIAMIAHNYADATCTAPKTCKVCKATEGSAAGHKYTDATCTAPKTCKVCGATEGSAAGHNYADATCTEPKACKVCGATEGSALGHSYSDGTCTRCGEADPNAPKVTYTKGALINADATGCYNMEYHEPRENGKIDYYVILEHCLDQIFNEGLASRYGQIFGYEYIVPKSDFTDIVKRCFVISDAEIEALITATTDTAESFDGEKTGYYENGYFHLFAYPVGGCDEYSHSIVSYTADAGVLTTYVDYASYDWDTDEHEHLFYYAVEYQYTGTSELRVYFDGYRSGMIASYDKTLMDSLKIVSIKKVDSIPANATPVKSPINIEYSEYSMFAKETWDYNYYVTVKVYDSDPTVGIYDEWSYHLDDCTKFKVNGNTLTCECGAVSFTDDEPCRSEENGYE